MQHVVFGYKTQSLTPSIWSSILMAVSGMGDALLYVYLPIKGNALGMSLFTIGFLLSVNKFSRLFTNRWVAYLSKWWGIKNTLWLGSILAGVTTFIYALNPVIWLWVLSRVIWGLAYSALRFSTIQYAGISEKTGSALGIGRSIQEAGPTLAYWIGPVMINSLGAGQTFLSWSLILFLLLPVFIFLPDFKPSKQKLVPLSFQKPTTIDFWIFISSFAIEGLLVVGVSKLMNVGSSEVSKLMIVSALYISSRRLLNIIISPVSGWISDTFGFKNVFHLSCILIVTGLTVLALGYTHCGILITFVGSAINLTLIPILAIDFSPADKSFDALTRMSTSRDLGSATGSLMALTVFAVLSNALPFAILAIALMFIWLKIPKLENDYE